MDRTHTLIPSPLGTLTAVADSGALSGLYFEDHPRGPTPDQLGERDDGGPFPLAAEQLAEYFAGRRTRFELPLAPRGEPFQRRVWDQLARIPYGRTRSYGQLARELGDPLLAQAVGTANGRNPLSVVVPCHRVVGSDGSLTGYAGGLARKRFLLELEQPAAAEAGRLF